MPESLFSKVKGFQPANACEKRLWCKCFIMNFASFLISEVGVHSCFVKWIFSPMKSPVVESCLARLQVSNLQLPGIFLDTFLCPYTDQNTQSKIEFSKPNLNFLLFHRLG